MHFIRRSRTGSGAAEGEGVQDLDAGGGTEAEDALGNGDDGGGGVAVAEVQVVSAARESHSFDIPPAAGRFSQQDKGAYTNRKLLSILGVNCMPEGSWGPRSPWSPVLHFQIIGV